MMWYKLCVATPWVLYHGLGFVPRDANLKQDWDGVRWQKILALYMVTALRPALCIFFWGCFRLTQSCHDVYHYCDYFTISIKFVSSLAHFLE